MGHPFQHFSFEAIYEYCNSSLREERCKTCEVMCVGTNVPSPPLLIGIRSIVLRNAEANEWSQR